MKRFTSILLVAILALGAPAFARKKGRKGRGDEKHSLAAIVKQFDKNANHQIDGAEIADLKAAFASAAPGDPLKKLDRNGNGMLDEDEITALNARAGSRDARSKKKKQT